MDRRLMGQRRGRGLGRGVKRLIDTVIAGVGLIVLAVPLAVLAVLVRITVGRPILFRQMRPGYRGKPFELIKFRTMHEDDGASVLDFQETERITKLGAVLRRTSLDELPELWNILKGDMSLVGPRPLLMEYLPLYTPEENRRHEMKPGLTGWAQIHGRRLIDMSDRFVLDVWYVDHWSLALDFKILAMTVRAVLTGEGVVPDRPDEIADRVRQTTKDDRGQD